MNMWIKQINELKAENKLYRDALAFYADKNRYIFGLIYHDELINDTGGRARQALKENDDGK